MRTERIIEWIEDSHYHGHRSWCKAIKGPGDENWYEHDQCDCGRNDLISETRKAIKGAEPVQDKHPTPPPIP